LLVLPGQFLHELAHAAAGERWAAETEVQWHPDPQVTFRWEEPAVWQVVVAHLAPTLIGLPLGVLIVASIAAGMGGGLPLAVWLWVFASWLYFSTPTPSDLDPLVAATVRRP
jgi:hypothetical protein